MLMSLFAATLTMIILTILGVPYAIPLGILVGIFDWLPLVCATIGAVIVVLAALFHSTTAAIVMVIFFAIYQQIENHVLQPLVQGRTVRMSSPARAGVNIDWYWPGRYLGCDCGYSGGGKHSDFGA
jgi:predicted PurR-regulated permease PerM